MLPFFASLWAARWAVTQPNCEWPCHLQTWKSGHDWTCVMTNPPLAISQGQQPSELKKNVSDQPGQKAPTRCDKGTGDQGQPRKPPPSGWGPGSGP